VTAVCGVYCITHVETGRQYIGKSVDIERRWAEHRSARTGWAIGHAIRKYGAGEFSFEILERCDSDSEALAAEKYWIEWYGSVAPVGFNLTSGGDGAVPSEETRKRMSVALTGRPGRPHSEEDKAKMRGKRAPHSKPRSAEHCEKLSESRRGKKRGPQTSEWIEKRKAKIRGRAMSPEQRAKLSARVITDEWRERLSAACTGKPKSAEHREKLRESTRAYWARIRAARGGE
jgi:group I intron endonuclease